MKLNYRKVIDHRLLLTVILVLLNTGVRHNSLKWHCPGTYPRAISKILANGIFFGRLIIAGAGASGAGVSRR